MNEFLASYYGTASAPESTESTEKVAQAELFAKLASDNGIDLNQLSDDQVQSLWDATFAEKTAEFPPKKDEEKSEEKEEEHEKKDEKEEKKAAAAAELSEKKAASEKFAEADFLGRVMAHSYVQELDKIAAARGESAETKEARVMPPAVSNLIDKAKHVGKEYVAGLKGKGIGTARDTIKRETGASEHAVHYAKQDLKDSLKRTGKAYGATAAGVGAAGAGVHHAMKDKKASAITELAVEAALAKVAEAGFDGDEAMSRLGAILVLNGGDFEGVKTASADNVDQAVELRSLELLEAAGYPVTWNV